MESRFTLLLPVLAVISSYGSSLVAEEIVDNEDERIVILSVRQKLEQDGRLKDVIQKTEVLDSLTIDNKNALSLTDALKNEPGVRVSNECSMCGVKRIMLNGMKGEHSTILVDDLPTHTMISGFYAVDSIATTGVEAIEIARGAGASLIAPEAIGGTINILTKEAYENAVELDIGKGSHDFAAYKMSATAISEDGLTGLTLVAQYDKQNQEDHDENGVSEAPFQENQSFTARLSHDLNMSNNIQIRVSNVIGEIFGGPVIGDLTDSIGTTLATYDGMESEHLFVNDDVREMFIGKPWETTEWIKTSRNESYIKWLTELSDTVAAEFAYSKAEHEQDSFYEGIDYFANDKMEYFRGKFDWAISQEHFLTFGLDIRTEAMRSKTEALQHLDAYISDSFDYDTSGLFLQEVWTPNQDIEIAMALRLDRVKADFTDPVKVGVEIEETILAPRLDIRYFHSETLTSRFSTGKGYRAPLSFFESDHGILDAELGFQIDVDELERSLSATYSLSYEGEQLTYTASAAFSEVDNLTNLEELPSGVPVLTQLDEKASVTTFDVVVGYQINDQWAINGSLENFIYNDNFKSSYGIAPIEKRAGLELNWIGETVDIVVSTTWFGERDLTDYGYDGYNIAGDLSSKKTLTGKSFAILNFKAKYKLSENSSIYFGASNLTKKTQIGDGDSPLFYNADGGYDVAYIYGPLHGREYYAGFEIKI